MKIACLAGGIVCACVREKRAPQPREKRFPPHSQLPCQKFVRANDPACYVDMQINGVSGVPSENPFLRLCNS